MSAKRLVTLEFREYVLAELRAARLRAKMQVCEIEAIGVALRLNLIEPEEVVAWMAEVNSLDFLMPTEPIGERVPDEKVEACGTD